MSEHSSTGRGGEGRSALSSRASLRSSFRSTGALQISLSDAAKVHRAADLVRAKAERHHDKHFNTKVAKAYTRLLLKSPNGPVFTPSGMASDPKAALMDRARKEVVHGHSQRLARIDQARTSMLKTGHVRKSRDLQWGGNQSSSYRGHPSTARPLSSKELGA